MANQAVGRPLGGIVGELAKLGINVVPDYSQPALGTVEFTGPTTLSTSMSVEASKTLTVKDSGKLRLEGSAALEVESGAVTLSSNAGTLSQLAGKITTESLTTAAAGSQALTITNTLVAATDIILISRQGGTSANGTPVMKVVPGSGSFVITLDNKHASAAFNGTFIIGFLVIKQAA
jgi:hypothetical protein